MSETPETRLLKLTAVIVAAHVSKNPTSIDQLCNMIMDAFDKEYFATVLREWEPK